MKRYFYIAICLAILLSLVSCLDRGQPAESRRSDVGTLPLHTEPPGAASGGDHKVEELVTSEQGDSTDSRLPEVDTFPLHSEPLATDWGQQHKMGELVLEDGCLRILEDPDLSHRVDFVPSFLPIWPEGFSWSKGDTSIEVFSPSGKRVARVGDYVRVSGDGVHPERHRGKQVTQNLSSSCEGPLFLVGDDVTAIESDEPEVVPIPDSDIYFKRVKTKEVGFTLRPVPAYSYSRMPSRLILEDDCILLVDSNCCCLAIPSILTVKR